MLGCGTLRGRALGWPRRTLRGSPHRSPAAVAYRSGSCRSHGFHSHRAALPSPPGLMFKCRAELLTALHDLLVGPLVVPGLLA
jgi:hypothetical protein